jgi:hypothetical protein
MGAVSRAESAARVVGLPQFDAQDLVRHVGRDQAGVVEDEPAVKIGFSDPTETADRVVRSSSK